jgi:hypothetical protein
VEDLIEVLCCVEAHLRAPEGGAAHLGFQAPELGGIEARDRGVERGVVTGDTSMRSNAICATGARGSMRSASASSCCPS